MSEILNFVPMFEIIDVIIHKSRQEFLEFLDVLFDFRRNWKGCSEFCEREPTEPSD
jgi:hypothetical protein